MALLQDDNLKSEQGFVKTIDEAGLGMVLDNLQRYQYQYPVKSTVRETASNGVDSIRERDIAKSILLGQSVVSDHYVEQEGDLFKASKFNKDYYNLDYLSDDPKLHIIYLEREGEERDLLRFVDHGVGLGGDRMEGFFSLSYSTKRLSKSALGKFGIGAKAPLSTGIPSYRMISVYNGQKYIFDIFSRHIQSIVDKWDNDGNDNQFHVFANGYSFYSEATTEKNGVTIELEVKKHQRSAYREAVQNQLLYFNNIDFEVIHGYVNEETNSYKEEVSVATKIVFENDDFIISNNNLFSKPHLVLGAEGSMVNYGIIDFKELELEPRTGNIGIKVDGSDIEITPSRESVVWSTKTRDVILDKFKKALEEADRIVSDELKDTDILKWIDKNISLWSSTLGSNVVLRQLSGMIDKTAVKSIYSVDNSISYDIPKKMLGTFGYYQQTTFESKYVNSAYKLKVIRTQINVWNNINENRPLFFSSGSVSSRKDAYIKELYGLNTFNTIVIPEMDDKQWLTIKTDIDERVLNQQRNFEISGFEIDKDWDKIADDLFQEKVDAFAKLTTFVDYAKQSVYYKKYDDIVVPDDWKDSVMSDTTISSDNGEIDREIYTKTYVDHSARRKEEGKVFFKYATYKTPYNHDRIYNNTVHDSKKAVFSWSQQEELVSTLNAFDGTLVYGLQSTKTEENNDEQLLKMVSGMLLNTTGVGPQSSDFDKDNNVFNQMRNNENYSLYPNTETKKYDGYVGTKDLMLLKVSKVLAKDLVNFIPISKFLRDIDENKKIFIHMKLINWFTGKQLHPILQKIQFLRNFNEISPYHAKKWKELYDLTKKYYFDGQENLYDYPKELKEGYLESIQSLYKFQRWIKEDKPSSEEIGEYSLANFGVPATNAHVVDLDVIHEAEELLDWAEPIIELLNNVKYFTNLKDEINIVSNKEEFLESVRFYLRSKSTPMIELPSVFVEVPTE